MNERILVVDDNVYNRKLACDLLTMEGFDVQSCEDAEQAMDMLTHMRPHLILMDIGLPGMDGLTFTRRLKADPRHASIPVIAFTAFAMKGDEQRALDAGCSGYISKPIDTRRLGTQVTLAIADSVKSQAQIKVMIVEDHRIDMKLAGDCVRLSGHVVLSSSTAEDALHSLADSLPDVVLLDLNLPGMDGLSFVKLLKADPQTAALPVVAVTAYPDDFQRDELLAAGCIAYLVKPFAPRELLHALELASGRA